MTKSQELYKKAKESGKVEEKLPWLQLGEQITDENGNKKGVKPTGSHIVKFVDDKVVKGEDYHTKEEREEIEWIFEEDGEKKRYRQPIFDKSGNLHYFVVRMKDFDYGDVLRIEMKKKGKKNFLEVELLDAASEIEKDNIPVIEEDENPNPENS